MTIKPGEYIQNPTQKHARQTHTVAQNTVARARTHLAIVRIALGRHLVNAHHHLAVQVDAAEHRAPHGVLLLLVHVEADVGDHPGEGLEVEVEKDDGGVVLRAGGGCGCGGRCGGG